jgi:hypothetical protein
MLSAVAIELAVHFAVTVGSRIQSRTWAGCPAFFIDYGRRFGIALRSKNLHPPLDRFLEPHESADQRPAPDGG